MNRVIPIAATILALSATQTAAQTERQLGPHQHGHGTLNLAIEGQTVQMALDVPGADIIGFEYEAETAEDRAKIEGATKTLAKPLALFVLPPDAGCEVTSAKISVVGESEWDHDEHDHHDHAEADEREAEHSEFHAEYALSCADVAAITTIGFSYFEAFPNSEELEVTLVTDKGQKAFEVNREHPLIDIRGMM